MSEPTRAGGSRPWRRARRHVTFAIGLAITVMLVLTAALSLTYTPRDPLEMSMDGRLQGPSRAHPFGTDQFGRDLLSRVMIGSVTSILVGVIGWVSTLLLVWPAMQLRVAELVNRWP